MKKISFFCLTLLLGLGLSSCSDDYTDWASPMSNAQEDAITIDGFTATGVDPIDLAAIGDAQTVTVYNLNLGKLPDGYTITNASFVLTPTDADNAVSTDAQSLATSIDLVSHAGTVSTEDLAAAIKKAYGGAPNARTFNGQVLLTATTDGGVNVTNINAGTVPVTVTLNAPVIKSGYYYIGTANNWGFTDEYPLSNGGGDVYDNPVFTVTVPAVGGQNWFKIRSNDASSWDSENAQFVGADANGESALTGTLVIGKNGDGSTGSGANSFCIDDSDCKFLRISVDMLNGTYTITKLNFGEYYYTIGMLGSTSWNTSFPMWGGNYDGNYVGYYYINGEYKFKPNAGDWTGDIGQNPNGAAGTLVEEGENNCPVPDGGAGFYRINLDLANMTYSTVKVEQVSIIGDFNSWGGDVDLTYNASDNAWEANNVNIPTSGGLKFRVNHDWTYSFGGTLDALTEYNGANINVDAGTYDVKVYLDYNNHSHATFTAK